MATPSMRTIGSSAGRAHVDDRPICVLTRFRLRSALWLVPTYLDYRRIAREARGMQGLLREAFVVENPVTCYSLSIWADVSSIGRFGTLATHHLAAARRMTRRARQIEPGQPEIWSTRWRLELPSHNVSWKDFPFHELVRAGRETAPAAVR